MLNRMNTYHIPTDKKHKETQIIDTILRTIPTERPPLVGEVSANICG
jgi:hypothetical protein